jgi:exopolysaccharide biosynthesis polyprenyl glycosylphosphotransferase
MESSFQTAETIKGVIPLSKPNKTADHISRPAQWRIFSLSLMLSDVFLTLLAFLLTAWIRFNIPLPFFNFNNKPTIPSLPVVLFVLIPMWLLIFALQGLYQRRNLLGGLKEYSAIFRATTVGMLLVVILGFLQPVLNLARGWVLLAWIFSVVFVISGRFVLRRVIYYLRKHGFFLSPALIIGANGEAKSLAEQLLVWRRSGLAVMGFISKRLPPGTPITSELAVLGTPDDVDRLVRHYGIEELILATSSMDQTQILDIFKRYGMRSDVNLRLSSGLFEIITTGLEVKEMASVPLVSVNQVRLAGPDRYLKSAVDLVLFLFLLIVFAPFLLGFAIAIKLDSPGPVLYRRRVMGLNGKQFDAFKFRTMHVNGDAIIDSMPDLKVELANNHKLKDDPRVTRLGHFLRKHSLDELPQLFNVLRREMSIVGPRMISPEELSLYEQWDINLLTVLPGITGLWQVSGRSDVAYKERVQLDMRYIRNWSIWLDIQILLKTVIVVLKGQGAY